jgi:uncharacterized protein YndB with AHSA1/START domain
MTNASPNGYTRVSRVIAASKEASYRAFVDREALAEWLPPGEMTGQMHEFDARVGGGYRMSLFCPEDGPAHRGKTSDREDCVAVRFVELQPASRIVEAVTFQSDDPALSGEMTLTVTFEGVDEGTRATSNAARFRREHGLRTTKKEQDCRSNNWSALSAENGTETASNEAAVPSTHGHSAHGERSRFGGGTQGRSMR